MSNKKEKPAMLKLATVGAPPLQKKQHAQRKNHFALVAIGNFFYSIGFSAEYEIMRAWRIFRDVGIFAGQAFGIFLKGLASWAKGLFLGIADDLAAPFRHFKRRRKLLARAQALRKHSTAKAGQKKGFARAHAGTFIGLGAGILGGIVLPLAAVAVLFLTVYSVLSMQYALAVELNGKVLGYVTDQSVVEGAKALLRDRIRLADNQEVTDWKLLPNYAIARAPNFTTTNQLANEILLSGGAGPGDIVPATGFYMGKDLKAVTTEGVRLKAYLDEVLAKEQALAPNGASVGFVMEIVCEPDNEDLFFATSVQDFEELMGMLQSTVQDEEFAEANGLANLSTIAVEHSLTLETLLARNPQIESATGEFVPPEGESILIRRAKPFLQVQSTLRISSQESLPYTTEERENPDRPKGVRQTVQRGQEGLQEVWDDEVWIDGELESRERLSELTVVLQEAQNEIIEIGTKEPQDYLGDLSSDGFVFPVPGTTYSTRGYSPGGHRGLDINAPAGMPIYACEAGVVINSGWHYSFGYYVEISHGSGINTLYAHCSALYVTAGQQVEKGTHIGAVGSTGNSSGNHCHLELTVNGQLVDPVAFVGYPY